MSARPVGWVGIARLGLVQASLGAVVVLTTATLNRVMVVELALAAVVPGLLVSIYHGVQILRPRFGHSSDVGRRRTPWIIGGMAVLATGGVIAAAATALTASSVGGGLALAAFGFFLIGSGAGAAGTSLLALTAASLPPERRPAAAAILWLMMIAGFVVTAGLAGAALDPFSFRRLVVVASVVCATAFVVATLAVWGIEAGVEAERPRPASNLGFRQVLQHIWAEREARRFTVFVFVAMLAYSAQDLILEPYAGLVFGMTPGETTRLASWQYGGVLIGMIAVAAIGTRGLAPKGWMRRWTIIGCLASAAALAALIVGGMVGPGWPLRPTVFALGLANGAFAVAAIGSMMMLAGVGIQGREGIRLGLWGAAQAIASALGGFLGTVAVDLGRLATGSPLVAYGSVFAAEAVLFVVAAWLAWRVAGPGGSEAVAVAPRGAAAATTMGG